MNLYLLQNSISKKLYIGISKNELRRLDQHNRSNQHYTGKQIGQWNIIGVKHFENKTEARQEEIRLKKSKNKNYILWYFNH